MEEIIRCINCVEEFDLRSHTDYCPYCFTPVDYIIKDKNNMVKDQKIMECLNCGTEFGDTQGVSQCPYCNYDLLYEKTKKGNKLMTSGRELQEIIDDLIEIAGFQLPEALTLTLDSPSNALLALEQWEEYDN